LLFVKFLVVSPYKSVCNDELDTILNSKSIVLTTPLICTSRVEQKSYLFD
jgi:hypothetical protein